MSANDRMTTFKPEGEVSIELNKDGSVTLTSDKPISSTINNIAAIGIENIAYIKAYKIERLGEVITHHVEFYSGGSIDLSFNSDGSNLKFTTHDMIVKGTKSEDGEKLMVQQKTA
ncbi:hypothetical protein [Enterobacter kobei]|uniref:hypothetical protein n=1 Tax=Enterobacter kobei TaxID=208224 RepID=UPI00079850B7|nr:hypothetical protein [Enterobacter kobei]SAF46409.1 Uncharacterised protein [Enterobacter kobei]